MIEIKFVLNIIIILYKYVILVLNFICRSVGVLVVILLGFVKCFDYDFEIFFILCDKFNYFWNVVFVEDDWWFVDCCWGVGWEDEVG